MNWNTLTTLVQFGGLGVRQSRISNLAILDKLIWSLLHEDTRGLSA